MGLLKMVGVKGMGEGRRGLNGQLPFADGCILVVGGRGGGGGVNKTSINRQGVKWKDVISICIPLMFA